MCRFKRLSAQEQDEWGKIDQINFLLILGGGGIFKLAHVASER